MHDAGTAYDPWTAGQAGNGKTGSRKRGKMAAAEPQEYHDAETGEIRDAAPEAESFSKTIAVGQLRAFIERIERLEFEKKTIAEDIKEVYAEAKGSGFDPKTIRRIIKLRTLDDATRQEAEAMLQLYMDALGMDGGSIV